MKINFLGFRLKEAREINKFSLADMSERIEISKQAISQFETGKSYPSSETLLKFARILDFPISYFLKKRSIPEDVSPVNFRKFSSSTKNNREVARIKEYWISELFFLLNKYISFPKITLPEFNILEIEDITQDSIEEYANQTRKYWQLGNGPITNLIRLCESNGIIVARTSIANKIDAFSLWRNNIPIIILGNDKMSAVRSRFDLAHELGHLVLHKNITEDQQKDPRLLKIIEDQADRFASSFLMPASTFTNELYSIKLDYLQVIKKRWLVSMQSMVMRGFQLGIITENQKSNFFRHMSINGFRKKEPLDDILQIEEAILFKKAISILNEKKILSYTDLVEELGLRIKDISEITGIDKNLFIQANNVIYVEKQIK